MYVDSNLEFANSFDLTASEPPLINAGTYWLYISNTVDLGPTGRRGLPFDHAFLKMVSVEAFEAASPPCVITVRLVSGATETLLADLLAGTFSQHYQATTSSVIWSDGAAPICAPIEPSPSGYQRYLGIVMEFSGSGLSAGRMDAYITMTPYENRPLNDSLPS